MPPRTRHALRGRVATLLAAGLTLLAAPSAEAAARLAPAGAEAPAAGAAPVAAAPAASGGTPATPRVVPDGAPGRPLFVAPLAVQLRSRRVLFAGRAPAQVSYLVAGATPVAVRIDLLREADRTLVARWGPTDTPPGQVRAVTWDGLRPGRRGGLPARDGRYRFALYAGPAAAVTAAGAPPTLSDSFAFASHVFPVAGPHDFGTAINRFGAPRGGRSHMGQDVLAACGVPLVAARGGTIRATGAGGGAGNYVVVHEWGGGWDEAYMHLREPPLVADGQRVHTGQLLGYVGRTGDATACHLHFELWTPPGWWSGGQAVDPLPSLRAWERAGG